MTRNRRNAIDAWIRIDVRFRRNERRIDGPTWVRINNAIETINAFTMIDERNKRARDDERQKTIDACNALRMPLFDDHDIETIMRYVKS